MFKKSHWIVILLSFFLSLNAYSQTQEFPFITDFETYIKASNDHLSIGKKEIYWTTPTMNCPPAPYTVLPNNQTKEQKQENRNKGKEHFILLVKQTRNVGLKQLICSMLMRVNLYGSLLGIAL